MKAAIECPGGGLGRQIVGSQQAVLDATTHDQQAPVLAGIEQVGRTAAPLRTEAVGSPWLPAPTASWLPADPSV
jgi:hypothetical protein